MNPNEVLIGTKEGVVRAYDVKRRPEEERWNAEMIKNMKGTPQQPDPSKPGASIPIQVTFDKDDAEEEAKAQAPKRENEFRRMRLNKEILEKYGYTEGCEGCRCQRAGIRDEKGRGRPHSEICRKRLMEAMEKDEDGRKAIEWEKNRLDNQMAVMIEQASKEHHRKQEEERKKKKAQQPRSDGATECDEFFQPVHGQCQQ